MLTAAPPSTPPSDYAPDQLHTVNSAARIAGTSPGSIRGWHARGWLKAIMTSSGVRLFKHADVLAAAGRATSRFGRAVPASRRRQPSPAAPSAVTRRTPLDELPEFLTVDELQAYLKIGRSAAYQFAKAAGVRFGRILRVPRERLRGPDYRVVTVSATPADPSDGDNSRDG